MESVFVCGEHAEFRARTALDPATGCWNWTQSRSHLGYGQTRSLWGLYTDYRTRLAHRIAYQLFRGPIPQGLEIDHLCRNRACVNPAHLEAVTHRENQFRSSSPHGINARKTSCPHGHEYDDDTMYVRPNGRGRGHCLVCAWARVRGLNPDLVTVEQWRARDRRTVAA